MPSHAQLVESATSGDHAAVAALLERHLPELRTYVRLHAGGLVLHKESASDLVQSACREVLDGLPGFEYRGEAAFRKWLFQAALNKIRERGRYHRAARRDVRREQPGQQGAGLECLLYTLTTPSQVAIGEERMRSLERAFAQLPDDDRRVITAARLLGRPHREIAAEMGKTEGSVRIMLHRALFRLGAAMGGL